MCAGFGGLLSLLLVPHAWSPGRPTQSTGRLVLAIRSQVDDAPLAASVQVRGTGPQRWLVADSTGHLSVSLRIGTYTIRVRAPAYLPRDTVVHVGPGTSNRVAVVLATTCRHDSLSAISDIARDQARLLRFGGVAPVVLAPQTAKSLRQHYHAEYYELGDNELEADACLAQSNRVTIRYIDGRYGRAWRELVPRADKLP